MTNDVKRVYPETNSFFNCINQNPIHLLQVFNYLQLKTKIQIMYFQILIDLRDSFN